MEDLFRKPIVKSKNELIDGVCGGLAESISIDPFWIRLLFVILAFFFDSSCTMLIIYLLLSFIMPEPYTDNMNNTQNKKEI